jgi:F0F1-type ATP synthase assembly protein I
LILLVDVCLLVDFWILLANVVSLFIDLRILLVDVIYLLVDVICLLVDLLKLLLSLVLYSLKCTLPALSTMYFVCSFYNVHHLRSLHVSIYIIFIERK